MIFPELFYCLFNEHLSIGHFLLFNQFFKFRKYLSTNKAISQVSIIAFW